MAETWPATVPEEPLMDSYTEAPPETTIRTAMDAGPAKLRRRYTAAPRPISVGFKWTDAQVVTWDAFFIGDLEGGALSVNWTNPRTSATVEVRILRPPAYTRLAPDLWGVQMEMEQLP